MSIDATRTTGRELIRPGRTAAVRRPRTSGRGRWRLASLLALAAAAAALLSIHSAALAYAATPAVWELTQPPWSDATVDDVYAADPWILVAVGPEGRLAMSEAGGEAWTLRSPAAAGFVGDLLGVAFADARQGVVVGVAGTLLVTGDGGSTWRAPAFVGPAPTVTLNDVALEGPHAAAVGDGGMLVERTTSNGAWKEVEAPTTADLDCVAVAEDGALVVGAADGRVLVRRGGVWSSITLPGPVTSVAARLGAPPDARVTRFVASGGNDVVGSEDGVVFATLLRSIYASVPPWPVLAWSQVPSDELLVAGPAGFASYYAVVEDTWTSAESTLGDPRAVTTVPEQSVAYVLGSDGRIARTFSSGRDPATLLPAEKTIKAGESVVLRSTVDIAAPGEVVVEQRRPGGIWRRAQGFAWTSLDWGRALQVSFRPVLTTYYRLTYTFQGLGRLISPTSRVTVRPKLTPDKPRIVVRRGDVFRFKGTVYPRLAGERVRLFTDRGGTWREVSMGGAVKLRDGTRWTSRLFGTPVLETYHLRARIGATALHGSSWSPVVTVVVR